MSISCPSRHLSSSVPVFYSKWHRLAAAAAYNRGGISVRGYKSNRDLARDIKWDPYSPQARIDLQAVAEQLKQAAAVGSSSDVQQQQQQQPQSADQLDSTTTSNAVDKIPQSPIIKRALRRRKRQQPVKRQPATAEEKALENDPWAAMLAQPIRLEIATKARLPTSLMTDWGLVKRPDTEHIYILPDSLADIDSLEKIAVEHASDGDNEKEEEREQEDGKESESKDQKTRGPVLRLLPSAQLLDRLTQMYTFVERPGHPASPRIMRLSVDLTSLLPQLWRERIARVRHYYESSWRHQAKTDGANGSRDGNEQKEHPPPPPFETTIVKANLKWQPDIEQRLLMILRTRLAVCLKRVLQLAGPGTGSQVQLQPHLLDLLDDINSGKASPSSSSSDTLILDEETSPDSQSHPIWGSGPYSPARILLYFSDPILKSDTDSGTDTDSDPINRILQTLIPAPNSPSAVPGIKATTYTDESETANTVQKVSQLLPPLLHHVPVFPVRDMLVSSCDGSQSQQQYNDLVQNIRAWQQTKEGKTTQKRILLSVSVTAADGTSSAGAGTDVLFAEIWRLWRYVGGRRCMS